MSASQPRPSIILCVPGMWSSRTELIEAIARSERGYLYAGQILMHAPTRQAFELEFHAHDPRMADAFRAAGPHWRDTPAMNAIGQHASVVYLIGPGGFRGDAHALMLAAAALLDAGGLGVKVESSGVAHSPDDWRALCTDIHLFSAHRAYVLYITGPQVYSCGMHNLGLRDAIIENAGTAAAVELLRVFTRYLVIESPTLLAGQTFSTENGAPVYRLHDDPGPDHGDNSLYTNPWGSWRLVPISMDRTTRWSGLRTAMRRLVS
ncbi:hypothetical protein ACG04R_03225 [Roseateles sp. BYS78W]|uniref:DUF4261 domain-containing protein n=1 Tax=Pelomonas candidula TaxID=3299025 RepID=A0ABW7H754_9BURK